MPLATLSIDLVAKLASFEAGMNRAADISEAQAKRIDSAMKSIKTTIEGLGIAALVASQINGAKAAIDTLDKLDDLSEKYGIAAQDLSAYRYASEVAGTSTEAFAAGLKHLSTTMSEAASGSKEQAGIFKALGISVKDANGNLRSADEVLLDVADKFKGYRDGAGKAADAQLIFGKSGAELIPILNRGRDGILELRKEAETLGAVYGNDLAKAAGDFNDNLKKLELASEAAKVSLVGSLLPSLVSITNQLIEGRKAYGGFFSATLDIGLNVNPLKSLSENLRTTTVDLDKAREALAKLDEPGKITSFVGRFNLPGSKADKQSLLDQIALLEKRQTYLKSQTKAELGPDSGVESNFGARPSTGKKPAPVIATAQAKVIDRAAKAYDELIAKITEKTTASQAELDTGEKVTAQQQFALEVVTKLAGNEVKLSDAQKSKVAQALENYLVIAKSVAQQAESLKLIQAEARELANVATARDQSNKALRDSIEEIGLSRDEMEALTIQRKKDALALEEQRIATVALFDAGAPNIDMMRRNADALRDEIALREQAAEKARMQREDPATGVSRAIKDYQDQIKEGGTNAYGAVTDGIKGLEDRLTDFFTKGKADWKGYFETIAAEALRVKLVQPAVNSLLDAVPGGVAGIASLFGYKDGAAFDAHGVKAFGSGDVFGSPTMFGYGNGKVGVLGEAGDEAVMPLRRGADGKLGVAAAGGGGVTVHQTNNIDARGADAGVELRIRQAMAQTKSETLALVQLKAGQGGAMSRAVGRK